MTHVTRPNGDPFDPLTHFYLCLSALCPSGHYSEHPFFACAVQYKRWSVRTRTSSPNCGLELSRNARLICFATWPTRRSGSRRDSGAQLSFTPYSANEPSNQPLPGLSALSNNNNHNNNNNNSNNVIYRANSPRPQKRIQ